MCYYLSVWEKHKTRDTEKVLCRATSLAFSKVTQRVVSCGRWDARKLYTSAAYPKDSNAYIQLLFFITDDIFKKLRPSVPQLFSMFSTLAMHDRSKTTYICELLHLLHQHFKPVNPNWSNTLETWLLRDLLTSPSTMTEKWRAIDFRWWIEITCICDINLHIFKISKLYISICLRGHMIYLLLKLKRDAPISSVHTITHVKHFNVSAMWNSELLHI